jgi:hypothetical protein
LTAYRFIHQVTLSAVYFVASQQKNTMCYFVFFEFQSPRTLPSFSKHSELKLNFTLA